MSIDDIQVELNKDRDWIYSVYSLEVLENHDYKALARRFKKIDDTLEQEEVVVITNSDFSRMEIS